MYTHSTQIRVRYGETDQMGYLYYGNYAQYFEVGRVELIRSLGITYKDMEDIHGIWLPVVSLEQKFVRPAYYDELLTVKTEVRQLPASFIVFHVTILNEKNKIVNSGRVRLCFFDAKAKKTINAPSFLTDRLEVFFQS
jgi:acyl-CoA thioester hydrolase